VLESAFLCQVLTQSKLNIRELGYSRKVETPVNAMVFATGNNLTIGGDAIRRSLLCAMDAGCERPELRTFKDNVIEVANARRGELVAAALTVLRAWHVAGETAHMPPLGSFEEWSFRIREPLVWLDKIDPCETLAEIRENDPHRGDLIAVIMQWKAHLSVNQQYTVQDIIGRGINVASFHTALLAVARARSGNLVSNERLGRWLKRVQGQIVNGFALLQDGQSHGHPLWKLMQR
jgi:putative DNA primase/helicase